MVRYSPPALRVFRAVVEDEVGCAGKDLVAGAVAVLGRQEMVAQYQAEGEKGEPDRRELSPDRL